MSDELTPLWTDEQIGNEVYTLALGYKARHVLKRMRDDYEAELARVTSKFEAAKESAEILSKLLEDARGRLAANGIQEDWGGDEDDDNVEQ